MIYRVEHRNNYTVVSNLYIADKLSLEAKGLLTFMLSKKVDWVFSINAMCLETGVSYKVMRRILNELIENGYVVEHKSYNPKLKATTSTFDVYEEAQFPKGNLQKVNCKREFTKGNLQNGNVINTNNIINTNILTNTNNIINTKNKTNTISEVVVVINTLDGQTATYNQSEMKKLQDIYKNINVYGQMLAISEWYSKHPCKSDIQVAITKWLTEEDQKALMKINEQVSKREQSNSESKSEDISDELKAKLSKNKIK